MYMHVSYVSYLNMHQLCLIFAYIQTQVVANFMHRMKMLHYYVLSMWIIDGMVNSVYWIKILYHLTDVIWNEL